MPLSRSNRIDRRRRVMLDAVAADSEFAVESVRARKRSRTREIADSPNDEVYLQKYRDPGYSQAVRKTCQQRMVQLIPVRRGTLSIVLSCMWMLWGCLLFSHYWIFTRVDLTSESNAPAVGFAALPIAKLFHLRSPHSIAQWLTCQLWMLTAVAAWMIFQLRRHKLDDYRARYRIWVVLAIAAAFSSFEASSSGLLLLGMSIDGWARREIGYAGWPLVLATFASIIGVIGIRLCSELKSAPMSVVSWLCGLIAWALAALLGTELLKISWSQATVDLVVGGSLLGGILAVFQASGIYLRQTYIQAQKRFLVRNGANLSPIQWKVPKLSLRRNKGGDEFEERNNVPVAARKSKWKMPWNKKRSEQFDESMRDNPSTDLVNQGSNIKSFKSRDVVERDKSSERGPDRGPDRSVERSRKTIDDDTTSSKPKGRLFGFIPHRRELNEKLNEEPIKEDDGPVEDQGLTKKRGWFGIGGNRDAELNSNVASLRPVAKLANTIKPESKQSEADKKAPISSADKKSFWSRKTSEVAKPTEKVSSKDTPKPNRGWVSKFSKSEQLKNASTEPTGAKPSVHATVPAVAKVNQDDVKVGEGKKSWLSFASQKPKVPQDSKVVAEKTERTSRGDTGKSGRRGLFGMLDGLKLKPPNDEALKPNSSPLTKPVPIKQGQPIPSTQADSDDEDGDDEYSGRPMSKADRKKLRRQNQDDRRAA